MPSAAWIVLGACCGVWLTWTSSRLLALVTDASNVHRCGYPSWWYGTASICGGITAYAGSRVESLRDALLLWFVMALALFQSPLDAISRRLSRPVTLTCLGAVAIVVTDDSLTGESRDAMWISLLVALLVGITYSLLTFLSPQSLGLGDALLVLPLALALAAVNPSRVAAWQILASCSALVHVVVGRAKHRASAIPFGPHLLGAAWVVLMASV